MHETFEDILGISKFEDLELILDALKMQRELHLKKTLDAHRLNRQAPFVRYQRYVNRCDRICDAIENRMKGIRQQKFEKHRQSKKYWRILLSNTNKLCK